MDLFCLRVLFLRERERDDSSDEDTDGERKIDVKEDEDKCEVFRFELDLLFFLESFE